MSSSENKENSKAVIIQVEEEWYYCSDTSDTDTYYSEEEDILCGFVKDIDSPLESDREISDTLKIYPESRRYHLQKHHPEILESLDAFHKEGAAVAYVSPSIAEDLQPNSTRPPRDVVCDECIFNLQKPVKILTITSADKLSSKLMRHNSKVARAFRGVDASSTKSKDRNPQTLSIDDSPKSAYLEQDQGCDQNIDLECDGHSDEDIEEINDNIPDTGIPIESNTNLLSEHRVSLSFDVRHDLTSRYKNPTNTKITDARSSKENNEIVKCNNILKKLNTVKYSGSPPYQGDHATIISPVQRIIPILSDVTINNGPNDFSLKDGMTQTVTDTKENSQQPNPHSDEDTSQFQDVDHDVLREISVISPALIKDEWEDPEAFLEKVKRLETLAREVELREIYSRP